LNFQIGQSASVGGNPAVAPIASIHSSFDNALERLSMAVQRSSKIADRLNRAPNPQSTGNGKAASPEPTMADKLEGLHALIGMLELNLNFIGENIG
jgi:hypothetical protein